MEIGIFFFPTDYTIKLTELAIQIEQRGFESLLLCEHTHIPASRKTEWPGGGELPEEYYHMYDPFVALSFAASVTSTLKIGTGICLVPQRDPFNLAKAVASIDQLSGGRFIFGIGGGWNVDEMENHGISYNTRFKVLREHILSAKEMWANEKAEFHGKFVDFEPLFSSPKPLQKPHPPILLGGNSDYTLQRVVDFCDGWLPLGPINMVKGIERLHNFADKIERDSSSLSTSVFHMTTLVENRPQTIDEILISLSSYKEAGVDRVLLQLPTENRDNCLRILDEYQQLL